LCHARGQKLPCKRDSPPRRAVSATTPVHACVKSSSLFATSRSWMRDFSLVMGKGRRRRLVLKHTYAHVPAVRKSRCALQGPRQAYVDRGLSQNQCRLASRVSSTTTTTAADSTPTLFVQGSLGSASAVIDEISEYRPTTHHSITRGTRTLDACMDFLHPWLLVMSPGLGDK